MGRAEDNQALKDLHELVAIIPVFEEQVKRVLVRNRFHSGQKFHRRGELGEMEGTPTTHYSDPTGEDAIYWNDWRSDSISKTLSAMAAGIHKWLEMAKWMQELSDTDVVKRAQRTIPDCMACGDPCNGRIYGGFDEKCYRRWLRAQRPDRVLFISRIRNEQMNSKEVAAQAHG